MTRIVYSPEKKIWVPADLHAPKSIYMDGYLRTALDTAKKIIREDWDMIFVYDGYEGTGKSVKCQQDAYYCDPSINIDRITFNPKDFKEAILKAQKYQSVILDEAYSGLSSRGAMSQVNKVLVQLLTVIREKNLFVFIVLPSFFDLDRYVALWRSRFLIHVYHEKGTFRRGFFTFFNSEKKKSLYLLGKQTYNYDCVRANFFGRFSKGYVVPEDEYRTKKRQTSITPDEADESKANTVAKDIRMRVVKNLKEMDMNLTQKQIAKIIGVTNVSVCNYLKEIKEKIKIKD